MSTKIKKEEEKMQENEKEKLQGACDLLSQVKESDGSLIILTGAGMSVLSGVPVFRHSDGSMSKEFLAFLNRYNEARKTHNLLEADDWFDFSVADMFRKETEKEAWHYWRWRILRALVEPAEDYDMLNRLSEYFGYDKVFIVTSNCDMLHIKSSSGKADTSNNIKEIHGSLGTLQCSGPCNQQLYPVDENFLTKLRDKEDPDWVPRCPACNKHCLRPNVMIFSDHALVYDKLEKQNSNYQNFIKKCGNNFAALEVGAGTVVASIRYEAERNGKQGKGLIRINPSNDECAKCDDGDLATSKYFPLPSESNDALEAICRNLAPF